MIMKLPSDFSVEERSERAKKYFHSGYNCCQAVVMAFADLTGLDENTIATFTSGFGGGMGRMREVCGTVSGMTVMAGFICPASEVSDKAAKTSNYALVQEFAEEFKALNGSIVCRTLLGLDRKEGPDNPRPSDRTEAYYKKRPCEELVGIAATIVAKKLMGEQ